MGCRVEDANSMMNRILFTRVYIGVFVP